MKLIRPSSKIQSRVVALLFQADGADAPAAKAKFYNEQNAAQAKAAAIPEVAQLARLRGKMAEELAAVRKIEADIATTRDAIESGDEDSGECAGLLPTLIEELEFAQKRYRTMAEATAIVYDLAASKLAALETEETTRVLNSHRATRDKFDAEIIAEIEALVTKLAAAHGTYGDAMKFKPFNAKELLGGDRPAVRLPDAPAREPSIRERQRQQLAAAAG